MHFTSCFEYFFMTKAGYRSQEPLSLFLEMLGDKWSLLIVRDIIMSGKNTYNEFLASEEKIATNMLADRLTRLEKLGIIRSGQHPDSKAKIYYQLTTKGIDLLPAMIEMMLWADSYLPVSDASRSYAKELRKNKEGFVRKVISDFKKKEEKGENQGR